MSNSADLNPRPHATVPVPHVKLTITLSPDQLPRDLLPREGAQAGPIDVVFSVAASVGRPALHIHATLNGKSYRRAVKAIDESGGNATVLIQGRLDGNRELLDAGISVQPKALATSAGVTSAPSREEG